MIGRVTPWSIYLLFTTTPIDENATWGVDWQYSYNY